MTTISPSLLSADFNNLGLELDALNEIENLWMHLDIMDGHYVPNLTFGHPVIAAIAKRTKHPLDAHLMVTNPEFYVETLEKFPIYNMTVHWETLTHADQIIRKMKSMYPSVGISLNPATPIEAVPDYIYELVNVVLVMSVNPGFSGQSFIDPVADKLSGLARKRDELGANYQLQIDGGVSSKNAKALIDKGASNLVTGSYLFKHPQQEYASAIMALR